MGTWEKHGRSAAHLVTQHNKFCLGMFADRKQKKQTTKIIQKLMLALAQVKIERFSPRYSGHLRMRKGVSMLQLSLLDG